MGRLRWRMLQGATGLSLLAAIFLAVWLVLWPHSTSRDGDRARMDGQAVGAWFPGSYEDSRTAFRASCEREMPRWDGRCSSFPIASASDPGLTIDTAYFSSRGHDLLVVQSGIHGPEAYAGSAIQQLLISRYLRPLLARGVDVYLIHAINPWGMAHNRRTDAFNVNLNRNFSVDDTLFHRRNPDYAALHQVFEPAGQVGPLWMAKPATYAALVRALFAVGFDRSRINNAMNQGQYEFTTGLNYGGNTHQAQTAFTTSELATVLRSHDGKVLFLDVHTGLGDAGALHIMMGKHPAPEVLPDAHAMFAGLENKGIIFDSTDDAGFYPTEGDVIDFVPNLAPDPHKVLALTMEFGTSRTGALAQLRDATRIILENQAYFNGCSQPVVCDAVRQDFSDLFNPRDPFWREGVLRQAEVVITRIVTGF